MTQVDIDASEDRIFRFLLATDAAFIPPLSRRVDLAQYAARLSSRAVNLFVQSSSGGSPIDVAHGAVYTSGGREGHAFLSSLAVQTGEQHRGIGALLLRAIEERSVQDGCRHLDLKVHVENLDARRFYERHGFVPVNGPDNQGEIHLMKDLHGVQSDA